jgi:hypothetical protein
MAAVERSVFPVLCEDLLRSGRGVRFRATGTSMHPAIRENEWVTVEPVEANAVHRGDVVLYRSVRGLTAHRVTRVVARSGVESYLVLRGDNAGESEERVAQADVLGRVTGVERAGSMFDPSAPRARLTVAARRSLLRLRRFAAALAAPARKNLLHELGWRPDGHQGGLL